MSVNYDALQRLFALATKEKQKQIREAARAGYLRAMLTEEIAIAVASWDLSHSHYTMEDAKREARRRFLSDVVFHAKVSQLSAMMVEYIEEICGEKME